jgi:hypothetical protein
MKTTTANLQANWTDADGFYEHLLDAHEGLSLEQSAALNAKLVLVLANQIGDATVLAQCIDIAAKGRAQV